MPLIIEKGATWKYVLRWEVLPKKYAQVTGITNAAPCVIAANHDIPNGWRILSITGVSGMTQINTHSLSGGLFVKTGFGRRFPKGLKATISSGAVELNAVNSSSFGTYSAGGVLEYYSPKPLVGFIARMQIRPSVASSTILLELTTANGKIILDEVDSTILLKLSATETAALTFNSAVASLEMEDVSGDVTPLLKNMPVTVKETDITR
jgi:hypothetical protein